MSDFEIVSQSRCFGGTQFYFRHKSEETRTPMRFAAFVPPQARGNRVPVVWWLSGLTCTEENFTVKAGAQRVASELGLLVIAPDTSPRGEGVPAIPMVLMISASEPVFMWTPPSSRGPATIE